MTDRTALLVERVRTATGGPDGIDCDATVVVGVSGGQDSVALLHLLRAARPDLELVVAHVRHGLREDSRDAVAAAANAAVLGVDFVECRVRVGEGRGPEDAARVARWAALRKVASDRDAVAVAVGHTMDDQAETVLLRIARGTGIAGLAGMSRIARLPAPSPGAKFGGADRSTGPSVIRPLLGERRAVIRLAAVGHPTVEDPTNTDEDQRRARARDDALPALSRLHPSEGDVVPLLARLADFARAANPSMSPVGDVSLGCDESVHLSRFGAAVDMVSLGPRPLHECQDQVRQAWAMLDEGLPWPGGRLLGAMGELQVGRSTDLPGGIRLTRVRPRDGGVTERVVICPIARETMPTVVLRPAETVAVPGFGTLRWAEPGAPGSASAIDPDDWAAWEWTLSLALAGGELRVRGRGPAGDRAVRRILQRFPLPLRGQVPLLVDARDRVVMAGHQVMPPKPPSDRLVTLMARPFHSAG